MYTSDIVRRGATHGGLVLNSSRLGTVHCLFEFNNQIAGSKQGKNMSGKRSIFNYGNGKCKHKQSNPKYRFVLFYLHQSAHFIPWKLLCYYYLNTIRQIFLNPKQCPMLLAHPSCAWLFYTQNAIRNLLFWIFQRQEDFLLKTRTHTNERARTQKRRFSENNSQI